MQFPLLNLSKFSFLQLWLRDLDHIKVSEHVQISPTRPMNFFLTWTSSLQMVAAQ